MPVTFKSGRGGSRTGAGRRSGWRHRETTLIRVPVAIAEELVRVAHELDEKKFLETETKSNEASDGQLQLPYAHNGPPTSLRLPERALARRLGVNPTSVRKARVKKNPQNFADWSIEKDPDGIPWGYDEHIKQYFQIL